MSEQDNSEVVEWTLRGIYKAKYKKPKHNPMGGEDGVYYINPPDAGVHHLMVEFGFTRSMAEWIANIT